jgi:Skp family chaperone for outer membrane proteins
MLRRSLVVLAAVTIAFTASACGDGGGGSAKEFCSMDEDKAFENIDDPKAMAAAFEKAKDKAPKELKDDMDILAKASLEFSEKTEGLDPTDEGYLEASQAMSTPEVTKAVENLTKFSEENCETE